MIELESSIMMYHDDVSINEKWSCLLRVCDMGKSDGTNILFNHILQHFWSSLVLKGYERN
jgi:hypothetical protein